MRAFVMTDFDAAPALTELDLPEPAEGEVRVRVRAASVNGFDLAVAAGLTKDYMEHRFPLVLGKDFAGEVDAVGAGVTDYAVGDRVFGTVTKPYVGDGSFAEYVTVPTAIGIAKLPESVSFTEGAALGLTGAAAHGIMDAAALQPGQTVLVVGATGGVGNQVVQLAKAAGARVIATAHTDAERELVGRLGADVVVDHQADLAAQVRTDSAGRGRRRRPPGRRPGRRGAGPRRRAVRVHAAREPRAGAHPDRDRGPGLRQPDPRDPGLERGQPGQRRHHRGHPGGLLPRAGAGSPRRFRQRHPGQGRHHHRLIGTPHVTRRPALNTARAGRSGGLPAGPPRTHQAHRHDQSTCKGKSL